MRALILILVILILPLAGCADKQLKSGMKEIEFWTIQLSGFSDYINSVIVEYEAENPDVKIKWVDVPFAEAEKRALVAVFSRDVPDLINMNPDFGATLAAKGALLNIKPLITQGQYNSYLEPAWAASTLDGFVFGVPWYVTSAVTIYNRNIWDGATPSTYCELFNIAQTIDKYLMMPALTENGKMLSFFNKYDVLIIDSSGKKAIFNTLKAEEVLTFWKKMYNEGYIPKESITEGHRQSLEKFMAGETAFIVAGENFINIIKENSPQIYKNIGISAQLTGSNGKADFAVMNFVIPKKSAHPQEALDFALFLTNAQNQLRFCKLAAILPSKKQVLENEYFNESISAVQLKNSLLLPVPPLKNRKDLYEIIDFMTQQVLLGYETPEQALRHAKNEWDKILSEN